MVANVANQLARAGLASRPEAIRYPDEVLRTALEGLVARWKAGRLDGTVLSPERRERLSRRARAEELAELLESL